MQLLFALFCIDWHSSFFGYYGRFNGGLLSIFSYLVLFYGFIENFAENRARAGQFITGILKVSLIASLFVILWGLSGKLGFDFSCLLFTGQLSNSCWTDQFKPAERMFSTLGQPNWLGAYLAINFFIAFYFFLKNLTNQKFNKTYLTTIFYLILNFAAVLFTRSRSSLLAIFTGILLLIILVAVRPKTYLNKKALLKYFSPVLILLLLLILIFKTGIEKIDKFITISSYNKFIKSTAPVDGRLEQQPKLEQNPANISAVNVTGSSDIRRIVWRGAIDLGLKYPVFGTGVETFAYSYYFTRPIEHNLTSEWDYLYNKAHNEYLNYLATTGFAGLTTYLFLLISVLLYGWKKIKYQISNIKNKDQADNNLLITYLLISFLTILITNFFGFSTTTINLYFYLIPAFLLVLGERPVSDVYSRQLTSQRLSLASLTLRRKVFFLFSLLTTGYLLLFFTRYYLADIKYAKADKLSNVGEYQNAANYLTQALALKHEHVFEDRLSHVLANLAFTASYQDNKSSAAKLRRSSEAYNLKSLKTSPMNVLYWKTRAKNYYLYYQMELNPKDLDEAINALKTAKKISPTDPKIPYSLAIFKSLLAQEIENKGKSDALNQESLIEVEDSIKLKSDYRDAYFLKGQLL